jgi:maleate cis-trans isomerase
VEQLEKDTERPVVSSTAAALWWILKTLGMKIPVDGFGKLLSEGTRFS